MVDIAIGNFSDHVGGVRVHDVQTVLLAEGSICFHLISVIVFPKDRLWRQVRAIRRCSISVVVIIGGYLASGGPTISTILRVLALDGKLLRLETWETTSI